jgi:LysM repeat protein
VAAVVYPMVSPWVAGRPGRSDGRVYRRRRAVALLVLVAAVFVVAGGVRLALAGSGGGALTISGSSGALAPHSQSETGHLYVVQPGDTLWSIVRASVRPGDPRPEVDLLTRQLGGKPLQIGQRLRLP